MTDFDEYIGSKLTPELKRHFKCVHICHRVCLEGLPRGCDCNKKRLTIIVDEERTIKRIFYG